LLFLWLGLAWGLASATDLDAFGKTADWTVSASDQVHASMRRDADGSLCLDYDFAQVSGYAVLRRELAVSWPANFELAVKLKGAGGRNDFQLKLVDASGDKVWWINRPDLALPQQLTEQKWRRRHIEFAWGPGKDRELKNSRYIEFVIAAGRERGKGSLCLAELRLSERLADPPQWPAPLRSEQGGTLTLDLRLPREFNGLALRWPAGASGVAYVLQASDDGRRWRELRRVKAGGGGIDGQFLPESEARFLRLNLLKPRGVALPQIGLRSASQWPHLNAMLAELAATGVRGDVPRAMLGQQNYWTLVGVDGGGQRSGLISEDGSLELGRGGPSVEPAVRLADGRVITWAGVALQQSLADDYLPQPAVHWRHAEFELDIEAGADGKAAAPHLLSRYRLRNLSASRQTLTLMLALRPWQVNPPQQFLSTPGGVSELSELRWDAARLHINGAGLSLQASQAPSKVSALALDGGLGLAALAQAPALTHLQDPRGHASAMLQFELTLEPGASYSLGWTAPLGAASGAPLNGGAELDARFAAAAAEWRERLNRVELFLPADQQALANTLRASLAHILMSRDGPALRPGTRAYARTWVRDGAMMVAGLLRLGEVTAAREFVDWYAGYIFESGKVPCCVDQRGADPVTENDSHGQYLYAVAELWRHTRDPELLARHWPQVQKVATWMEGLRQSERLGANRARERAHLFGLMPPSISHEGYSDKPAYSNWDNFWALRGYKDAVLIAAAMGQTDQATRWAGWRDEFAAELAASVRASAKHHRIDFIAGAADRGDFDATSSTVALDPAQAQDILPADLLQATFERYWQEMSARSADRRLGIARWRDYTPYELRTVGALLRLGQGERAHAMLDFFFQDQRPAGWLQWAEVVLPDAREARFLGDMPHAWISSDFIRSALDIFAFERGPELLIGAGLKQTWLNQGPFGVKGLGTSFGPLDYRIETDATGWQLQLGRAGAPVSLRWPGSGALPLAVFQGRALSWEGRELRLPPAPAILQLVKQAPPHVLPQP
jgi:hypothetical protein